MPTRAHMAAKRGTIVYCKGHQKKSSEAHRNRAADLVIQKVFLVPVESLQNQNCPRTQPIYKETRWTKREKCQTGYQTLSE